MSYILEFPPRGPLPREVRSPPYVLFGINNFDCFHDLPRDIPLALVLHYVPKLQQWMLPPAQKPTHFASYRTITKPYVGINILADICSEALCEILVRLLQHAGPHPYARHNFYIHPTIGLSRAIHQAWLALGLPLAGLANLHTHMQSQLIHGPSIHPAEIRNLWELFPTTSPVLHEMGINFIRSHLDKQYTQAQFSEIRHWYLSTKERCRFFEHLESQFAGFESVQVELIEQAQAKKRVEEAQMLLLLDRRDLERAARATAKKRRIKGIVSNESLRSVVTAIFDSKEDKQNVIMSRTHETKKRADAPTKPCSLPVNPYALAETLERLAIKRHFESEKEEERTTHLARRVKGSSLGEVMLEELRQAEIEYGDERARRSRKRLQKSPEEISGIQGIYGSEKVAVQGPAPVKTKQGAREDDADDGTGEDNGMLEFLQPTVYKAR